MSWPIIFLKQWSVKEMRYRAQRSHVLKHLHNVEERWDELCLGFTIADRKDFQARAQAQEALIWFPPEEIGESTSEPEDAWLAGWPRDLLVTLDQHYRDHYRPYTERVIEAANRGEIGIYNDRVVGAQDAVLLLDKSGVLVILKVTHEENKLLRWATSYRPKPPQRGSAAHKKWRDLVRGLEDALSFNDEA